MSHRPIYIDFARVSLRSHQDRSRASKIALAEYEGLYSRRAAMPIVQRRCGAADRSHGRKEVQSMKHESTYEQRHAYQRAGLAAVGVNQLPLLGALEICSW